MNIECKTDYPLIAEEEKGIAVRLGQINTAGMKSLAFRVHIIIFVEL
jgi:hypothetical protein